jgi:hypothetical protein
VPIDEPGYVGLYLRQALDGCQPSAADVDAPGGEQAERGDKPVSRPGEVCDT